MQKNIEKDIRIINQIIRQNINNRIMSDILRKFNLDLIRKDKGFDVNKGDNSNFSNYDSILKYYEIVIRQLKQTLNKNEFLHVISILARAFDDSRYLKLSIVSHQKIIKLTRNNEKYIGFYANALYGLGGIYLDKELWKLAIGYTNQAKRIFIKLNDQVGILRCYNLLGLLFLDRGNLNSAKNSFRKCINYSNNNIDIKWLAKFESNLGAVYCALYDFDNAYIIYKRALIKSQLAKDDFQEIITRLNIAHIYLEKKDYTKAISEFDLCILISLKNNYRTQIGRGYAGKSMVYLKLNDIPLSMNFCNKSFEYFNEVNDFLDFESIYRLKGIIKREKKNYKTAEKYFLKSNQINYKLRNWVRIAENEYELGILYKIWDKKEKSLDSFINANKLYKKSGIMPMVKKTEKEILKLTG